MSVVPIAPPPAEMSTPGCLVYDWTLTPNERPRPVPAARRRGLVLDLDDTLYPREDYVQSSLLAAARHVEATCGVPAAEAFRTMTCARRDGGQGRELQILCAAHALPDRLVPELVRVMRGHRPRLHLPPATGAVLARLRAEHWRMAILTNGLPYVQRAKVAALGLHALVDHVVYAEEQAPGGKPGAAAFRAALRVLGLPASRCICVGDDPIGDISGGRAAGLKTIRLTASSRGDRALVDADATIDTLEALPVAALALLEMVTPDAA